MIVKGYKVFNPDWTCMNKQYTCPGTFEEDINPSVCNVGMLDEKTIKETAPWELAWEDVQFGLEYYKQPLPGGAMFWKRIDQNRQHAGIMNYDDYAIILQDGKFFTCGWIPKISVIAELVRYFVLK